MTSNNSNNAGSGDSEESFIMNMLSKQPVYSVVFGALALYAISMIAFYLRDQDTHEKTWIEKSSHKEEEHKVTKTPRNSVSEKRETVKKSNKVVEKPAAPQIEEIEEDVQEAAPVKADKKKNKGLGKGKKKNADTEALQQEKIETAKAIAAEKKRILALELEAKEKERKAQMVLDAKKKQEQEKRDKQSQIEEMARQQLLVKKHDIDFEVSTGRVKVAKEIRKVRERKDSLDDHSSDSSEEEHQPRGRRGRQTNDEEAENERKRIEAKAEAKAQAEAELAEILAKEAEEAAKSKVQEAKSSKKQAKAAAPAKSVQKAAPVKQEAAKPEAFAPQKVKNAKKTAEVVATPAKPAPQAAKQAPEATKAPKIAKTAATTAASKKTAAPEKRPPSPEYDEESGEHATESYGSSYDEEAASSEDDENIIIQNVAKNSKMQFAPKGKKPPQKEDAVLEQNAYQQLKAGNLKAQNTVPQSVPTAKQELVFIPAPENGIKPKKGSKFKKILAPKKKVADGTGDWEVVEKRDAFLIERPVDTDSGAEDSELSSD